jgi:hypothetical protein
MASFTVDLPDDQMAQLRSIVPDIRDKLVVKEIVRRYLYLHKETGSMAGADHLMKYWRDMEQK